MPVISNRVMVSAFVIATGAVILATAMFWKHKPIKDTVVVESGFRLTLPGQWNVESRADDSNRWTYFTDGRAEQLTVSLYGFEKRLNKDEQSLAIQKYAEAYRRANEKLPGLTPVTMTDTVFGESGGTLAARFGGEEPARHRRFQCLTLCSPVALAIFYYEAVDLTQVQADDRAKAIMNSIGLVH